MRRSIEDKILDYLCKIPQLDHRDNRDLLLRNIPSKLRMTISRSTAPLADFENMLRNAKGWGSIENLNKPARTIILENTRHFVKGAELEDELETLLAQLIRIQPRLTASLPHHLTKTFSFDLDTIRDCCINCLEDRQGLIGFTVPYQCMYLTWLENLCQRLENELGQREVIFVKPPVVIKSITRSIKQGITLIKKRDKANLERKDLVFAVSLAAEINVAQFWNNLHAALNAPDLENRIIVIMTVNTDRPLPEEIIPLDSPCFTYAHIKVWVNKIVDHFMWPVEVAKTWIDAIKTECIIEQGEYEVDQVYTHLTAALDFFKQHEGLTPEEFTRYLQQRKQLYEL